MPNNYIKYFYKSYPASKRLGLHREYLFLLKLKYYSSGILKRGSIITDIQEITSYSPASISIYIKKLLECGFLIPFSKDGKVIGYNTISYKDVLKLLGVKIRFSGKNLNIAKEHRFNRILLEGLKDNKDFKNFIELQDLYKNSNNQSFKQKKKLINKITYRKSKNDPTQLDSIKQLQDELKSVSAKENKFFKISCKKLSRMLGYKSIQQGSLIERRAEKNNFLTIKRHLEVIEKKVEFVEFMSMRALDNSLYWMFGNVVKNSCNELLFTDHFFSHFESNKQNTLLSLNLKV